MKLSLPLVFLPILFLIFLTSCDDGLIIVEKVPDEVPISSYNQYGTPLQTVPAAKDIIMYEVNLRAFSQEGSIEGVTNRLDNLADLGINVIWLMPIHPIGEINSVNSPYSVKDYKAISSEYGTIEDLRFLSDEAHKRGIAIMMDWVANHTSWDNNWILNTSWYSQDGSGNIIHPPGTNWLDVADLNFSNMEMRAAMIDAMKYWVLEANIDGFRCDYADGVPFGFWNQAFDSLEKIPERDLVLLAEGSRSDHFDAGFDLTFGWEFYGALKGVFSGQSANTLFTKHTAEYSKVPDDKEILRFTTNHDESAWDKTPMVLFNGSEGAIAASTLSLFIGGVPLLYTGQEVGRESNVPFFSKSPINWTSNPGMEEMYQMLYTFYSENDVAKVRDMEFYEDQNIICFSKKDNTNELLVIVNVRNNPIDFNLPSSLQNTQWYDGLSQKDLQLETLLPLENYEVLILIK